MLAKAEAEHRKILNAASAEEHTGRLLNKAAFEKITVAVSRIHAAEYRPPFDDLFAASEFE